MSCMPLYCSLDMHGSFILGLHSSIWRPEICIWRLFFTNNYYLLTPFLKYWPLKQASRGHFGPQVQFSGRNTVRVSTELHELQELQNYRTTRTTELHELQNYRTTRTTRTTELHELATRTTRTTELHKLQELQNYRTTRTTRTT